ncbi:MAG: aminotransferase class III-fold pyridoxal phosphate-dependent enzyme [Actinomycetota bacterium]
MIASGALTAEEIVDLCRRHTLFEWGTQQVTPMAIARGEGCYLYTVDGDRILDFNSIAMNANIGHGDQRVTDAVAAQMADIAFVSPFMATEVRARVAHKLAEVTPAGMSTSFFTLAGADANEVAIRTARLVTGRQKILTRYRSYHGGSRQALAASGDPRRRPVESGIGDIVRLPDPYHYRFGDGASPSEFRDANLRQIEEIIRLEDPDSIAAILVEPITGSNGLIVPPEGWLAGLSHLCQHYGVLLICDEVMSGFGRTGAWFACDHEGVSPDIMTVAKGITSGYVPLGACVVSDEIAAALADVPIGSGLTYQSHPVGLAAAAATLAIYESDDLIARSAERGRYLLAGLRQLQDDHPSVGDVRGKGLFAAIELVYDRQSREELLPLDSPPGPESVAVSSAMAEVFARRGLFSVLRGPWLFANPPLVVTDDQIDWALEVFDEALGHADKATSAAGAPPPPHLDRAFPLRRSNP